MRTTIFSSHHCKVYIVCVSTEERRYKFQRTETQKSRNKDAEKKNGNAKKKTHKKQDTKEGIILEHKSQACRL